jgi:NhaP-type Na+/H+ or K+/H+ antiporter
MRCCWRVSRSRATAVVFQFCGTFGVWTLAGRLHLSGIITMVVYAMVAARRALEILPARGGYRSERSEDRGWCVIVE